MAHTFEFSQIEEHFNQLPLKEQLWWVEQLLQRIRERNETEQIFSLEKQLKAMAADPEIQSEMRQIEQEFSITEIDGLERRG